MDIDAAQTAELMLRVARLERIVETLFVFTDMETADKSGMESRVDEAYREIENIVSDRAERRHRSNQGL